MSDSREILESRPNPVISIFIILLSLLLGIALVWSFFGEIDTVAKAEGIVRSNEKISTIQVAETGKVIKMSYMEGKQVKVGELLVALDQKDLNIELNNRETDLKKVENKLSFQNKYKDSVEQSKNLFLTNLPEERPYYDQVQQYLLDYNRQGIEFQSSRLQDEKQIHEIDQTRETIKMNLGIDEKEANQKRKQYETQKQSLDDKIALLSATLENEKLLKQAIEGNDQIVQHLDNPYQAEYMNYSKKKDELLAQANGLKEKYERSLQLSGRFVSNVELQEEKQQYDAVQLQIGTYQSEMILNAESKIKDLEKQLSEEKANLDILTDSQTKSYQNETLGLQDKQISDKKKDLQEQVKTLDNLKNATLDKFKSDRIVEINLKIDQLEMTRDNIKETIQNIKLAKKKRNITAPISGVVSVIKEFNIADSVQSGDTLLSIIPNNESKYKMNIAVPNNQVGKIHVGDKVEFNLSAFPKQSYGSVAGTVTSISSDAIVQQNGMNYYLVEASISNEPLMNRKKEKGEIRVGMTAEAYVITGTQKVIDYILEKINLKE
jgi:HlyD family secretion protein